MIYFDQEQAIDFRYSFTGKNRVTLCSIVDMRNGNREVVCAGMALMHEKEKQDNKALAREIALGRALKNSDLPSDTRKKIMDAYKNRPFQKNPVARNSATH